MDASASGEPILVANNPLAPRIVADGDARLVKFKGPRMVDVCEREEIGITDCGTSFGDKVREGINGDVEDLPDPPVFGDIIALLPQMLWPLACRIGGGATCDDGVGFFAVACSP